MNASGPVLRDIHLPPAAWWPLAPGWWLLALGLIFVLAGFALWWWVWQRGHLLHSVMREIDAIEAAHAANGDAARLADHASRLLRRVARRVDPAAAAQGGEAWRAFLHHHAHDPATRKALDDLADARFRAHPVLDAPALMAALRAWCRNALRGRSVPRACAPAATRRVATP